MFRVADPDLLIVHQPHDNAEFMRLRQATNTHGIATSNDPPPPPAGFSAQAIWGGDNSRPASQNSFTPKTLQIFRTRMNFDKGGRCPLFLPPRDPQPPSPGADIDNDSARNNGRSVCLEGVAPEPFKGEHSDTQRFLLAFDRYSFMNHDTTMI